MWGAAVRQFLEPGQDLSIGLHDTDSRVMWERRTCVSMHKRALCGVACDRSIADGRSPPCSRNLPSKAIGREWRMPVRGPRLEQIACFSKTLMGTLSREQFGQTNLSQVGCGIEAGVLRKKLTVQTLGTIWVLVEEEVREMFKRCPSLHLMTRIFQHTLPQDSSAVEFARIPQC